MAKKPAATVSIAELHKRAKEEFIQERIKILSTWLYTDQNRKLEDDRKTSSNRS